MPDNSQHSNWIEVDLGAIAGNTAYVRSAAHTGVMAVVKANAYGHGAVPVARAALRGGASWCAVARLSEALELRRAGMDCPILLLGYTPPGQAAQAIAEKVSMTVWSTSQIELASRLARQAGEAARLHLKIDTGMGRLGAQPAQVLELARTLAKAPGVLFEGVFTHFARADELDQSSSDEQEWLFRQVLAELEGAGLQPEFVHAANSAAGLNRLSAAFNLVRLGIGLYGLHPSTERPLPQEMRPALSWKAVLSQVKFLPAGSGVSYGHEYVTSRRERIGTIPVGYADGMRRVRGNQALVGGQRVPLVGRVCMDQVMVQLDALPESQEGDEVVLLGSQGEERISAEEIAERWGTINYEVVCGLSARVPRHYFNEP